METPRLHLAEPDDAPESPLEIFELAKAMLTECKQRAQLQDLDTAILLFREALVLRPNSRPMRMYALNNLAMGLLTRFDHLGRMEDLDEAISLARESGSIRPNVFGNDSDNDWSNVDPISQHNDSDLIEDEELSDPTGLARDILAEFNRTTPLSSLETCLAFYRDALHLLPPPHFECLLSLAVTHMLRFRHTSQLGDLDEAISLLGDLDSNVHANDHPTDMLASIPAAFLTKFIATGSEVYREEALTRHELLQTRIKNNVDPRALQLFEMSLQTQNIDSSISMLRHALRLLPTSYPDRSSVLINLGVNLHTRFERAGNRSDLDEAIVLQREALSLLPASHRLRHFSLINLGNAIRTRVEQFGDHLDLVEAIALHREALNLLPAWHPHRSTSSNNLGIAILRWFEHTGNRSDLDEAIVLFRESLSLRPRPHPDRPSPLSNLANAILTRFQHAGDRSDLNEAIVLHREALSLPPALDPNRSSSLNSLADAITMWFEHAGDRSDLEEAIVLYREALSLRPVPHLGRPGTLSNLSNALMLLFDQTGDRSNLEEAIVVSREAISLRPAPHPERPSSLNNLAVAMRSRFTLTDCRSDLDEAIVLHRETLSLRRPPHPDRPSLLSSLASALIMRFERAGDRADLDEAIAVCREALSSQHALHSHRPLLLGNLATAILYRFNETSDRSDLDEGIKLQSEAIRLLPALSSHRPASLNNLAAAFKKRFEWAGERSDLDEAIVLFREALSLRPAPNAGRPDSLINLATVIVNRFRVAGDYSDLDEAILLHREAISLLPAPHSHRPASLNNLAAAIMTRFEHVGDRSDLDEAIGLHSEALRLRPAPHIDRPESLHNLATVKLRRFMEAAERSDLDEAIVLIHEALDLRPAPHTDRWIPLSGLADAMYLRFQISRDGSDLSEAIVSCREALSVLPTSHPERPALLYFLSTEIAELQDNRSASLREAIALVNEARNLFPPLHPYLVHPLGHFGSLHLDMYDLTHDSNYLESAAESFREAVNLPSASTLDRFTYARFWARHADMRNHPSALEAYQHAIELLPRLATLGHAVQARQEILASRSDGLARNAAACAIQSGEFGKAVEFLEQGRTTFWAQALRLRTPLDSLSAVAPVIAERFKALAHRLEQGSHRDSSRARTDSETRRMSLDQEAALYRQIQDDWEGTLSNIRNLNGFHDFLKPTPLHELQRAAKNGPVVMLNVSNSRCDALIVTPAGVSHVPFPDLNPPEVVVLARLTRLVQTTPWNIELPRSDQMSLEALIQKIQVRGDVRLDGRRVPRGVIQGGDILASVLESLWFEVIQPVISHLQLTKYAPLPRLWWCPTGSFAFLPIHAAGIYGCGDSEGVSDYVVSSYTPTLQALLTSQAPQLVTNSFKMLVAIQPAALPCTLDELRKVEKHVSGDYLVRLGVPEAAASVDNVALHLSDTCIAHFACHGIQDRTNPLDSALMLDDGPLPVSRIMKTSLLNASLVFLCACETAKGDANVPDEAMHLAGTMLYAGFRGAVATMWSMHDEDGPRIADSFYEVLSRDPTSPSGVRRIYPDAARAAEALHTAVARLREEGAPLIRWVPFVHYGL